MNIRKLMYSFGDSDTIDDVDNEAVECLCGMVHIYLKGLLWNAANFVNVKGKFDEECFLLVVKSELGKFKRSKELIGRKLALEKEIYMDF